ncbi:RNA pol II accessory factor, Cdc73 family-domain-containing protein [Cyathus striatus]|nr:RNA pol II accessory factor, Cdc73 family-domain-containing protein [Cyathus striatus]
MKQAREAGLAVGFVSVTERKSVVEWLEGRGESDRVVPLDSHGTTTPPGSPRRSSSHLPQTSPSKSTQKPTDHTSTSQSTTKKRYLPDSADVEILRDRNTVLRGLNLMFLVEFHVLRTIYADKLKRMKEASRPQTPPPQSAQLLPIIMISSSPTALITMHNEARAKMTSKPEDLIAIYRTLPGLQNQTQRYFIVDSTEALSKFGPTHGTESCAWQFRPYKWNEPRTLFHHVKGIYVSWTNDPPNPKIQDWNVTELKIDQHRRHVDKSVVAHFWKTLDTWIAANKPWLMKS